MTVGHSRPKVNFVGGDEQLDNSQGNGERLENRTAGREKQKAPETCVSGADGGKTYFERFFGLCLFKTESRCLASTVGATAPPSTIDFAEIFFP